MSSGRERDDALTLEDLLTPKSGLFGEEETRNDPGRDKVGDFEDLGDKFGVKFELLFGESLDGELAKLAARGPAFGDKILGCEFEDFSG